MENKRMQGLMVTNYKNEEGTIVECENGHVKVQFADRTATFQHPKAFLDGFLIAENDELQNELVDMAKNAEKVIEEEKRQKRIEEENRKEERARKRGIRGEHKKLVSKGECFRTHADALNECFGFEYKHYQKAYKQIDDRHGAWFPSIAKRVMGEYLAADTSNGWLNILCENDSVIFEKNVETPSMNSERDESKDVFVFAKMDGTDEYMFLGLYRSSRVPTERGFKYERLGVQINLDTMEVIQ